MKITRALAMASTTLVLAGCQTGPSSLEQATENCLQSGSEWFEVQDGGKAVHLQVAGLKKDSGLDDEEADCVLKDVGAPDSIFTKMNNTSGDEGEQSASWDGFGATWTFDVLTGTSIQVAEK